MNKVLIVTYYWPPGSGAGVQRWLKFAKYLPASGWEPFILTVDSAFAAYPVTDDTLSTEISPELKVCRTRATDWFRLYSKDKSKIPSAGFATNDRNSLTGRIIKFIRGNFFIPDPRKGWNSYALREASAIIEREGIKHVITTSPPHSTQLIGLALKKKHPGISWIADLRDPWTDIYYYDSFYHTSLAKKIDSRYEKEVLLKADRIITVGNSLKESFSGKINGIGDKITVITNGYDEDDFSGIPRVTPSAFIISYIGTLSGSYPVTGFMNAVGKLSGKGYAIKLRFVGSVSSGNRDIITSKAGSTEVEFIPYVNHAEAIRYMMGSSVLLLVIPDHHSNRSIITGKLFEYLASGKPILCIGPPDGDAAEIIESSGNGGCAGYDDTEKMDRLIDQFYKEGTGSVRQIPSAYSRESLTKKLTGLF